MLSVGRSLTPWRRSVSPSRGCGGRAQGFGGGYGSVRGVRAGGGLVATGFDRDHSDKPPESRNGYTFKDADFRGIESALSRAIGLWFDYPKEFRRLITNAMAREVTTGPDGNVWFTEEIGNNIVRLDPDDPFNQTEFPLETEQSLPWNIAPGPDGNLWFTELAGRNIGKITPQGTITEYPVPGEYGIAGIAAAPTGNRLWFTENDSSNVGVIDVNGQGGATFDTPD